MKKVLLSAIAILALATSSFAQTDKEVKEAAVKPKDVLIVEDTAHHYWKKGAFLGINFGQAALFNWAAGGQNTISLQVNANGFINYAKGHLAWDNSLNFSLGGIVQGHVLGKSLPGARPAAFRKNVDQLQVTSRVGYIIDKKKQWMAAFLADYKTSVLDGNDYGKYDADPTVPTPQRISSPFSPSFVVLSLGINYKPAPFVSFYLSPVAGKLSFLDPKSTDSATYVGQSSYRVEQARYGFQKGKNFRGQLGAYFRIDFQKDIMKNVNLKTTLELFTPYTNEIITNAGDSTMPLVAPNNTFNTIGKIDVNWLTGINFKVNKYITCSLEWQLIYSYATLVPKFNYNYDPNKPNSKQVENRYNQVQFREGFTLGFGYKFAEKIPAVK